VRVRALLRRLFVPKSLSFITPSGRVTLGNYIGALSHWKPSPGSVFAVADLHGITTPWDPERLRANIVEIASTLLALDLDQDGGMVFVQSEVPAHAQMAWLLQCLGHMGEFQRMTQFKAKGRGRADVGVGLFTYPALMAADILLYDADAVPVGEDQRQHVELTRDLALRANHLFGPVFTVPEPAIPTVGARVRSLKNPAEKMSKSVVDDGTVLLLEPEDQIRRKFMAAVTDSGREVYYDLDEKPGISNLLEIHAALSGETIEAVAERHRTGGYGTFKRAVAEVVVEGTRPVRERALALQADPEELHRRLQVGRERAVAVAGPKLAQVMAAMGFLR
jgi:tryptophanyl-tRNA synthetase